MRRSSSSASHYSALSALDPVSKVISTQVLAVFRIRIRFIRTCLDPAQHLKADPDQDPGCRSNADPDLGSRTPYNKVLVILKNILTFLNLFMIQGRLCLYLRKNVGKYVNLFKIKDLGSRSGSLSEWQIPFRITDPDPGDKLKTDPCGSGSETLGAGA